MSVREDINPHWLSVPFDPGRYIISQYRKLLLNVICSVTDGLGDIGIVINSQLCSDDSARVTVFAGHFDARETLIRIFLCCVSTTLTVWSVSCWAGSSADEADEHKHDGSILPGLLQ
jgi:hypothetical protein